MWKKLSSKIIFEHPRLKLGLDQIVLPSGKQIDYLVYCDRPDTVMVIAQQDQNILILKEYTWPIDQWINNLPGGGVNIGEQPEVAANRELGEEAGFTAKTLTPIGQYYFDYRRSAALVHVFLATDLVVEQLTPDEEELIKPIWLNIEQVDNLIQTGQIISYHVLASWSLFKAYQSKNNQN